MITANSMAAKADSIGDLYSNLESDIIDRIIAALSETSYSKVDQDNIIMWQAEQLNKMGMLTQQVVQLLAELSGKSEQQIDQMVTQNGMQVSNEISDLLNKITGKQVSISADNKQLLKGIQKQTFTDLNNVVNQSLISANVAQNGALKAYQQVINQSAVEVVSGLKTFDRAVADNVYNLVDSGIRTGLVDKAGHNWSLEGYSRMVLQTTAHNTFNEVRMNGMHKFDVTLAAMDAHPAAREACAPIQGKVVNTVSSSDPRFNSKYDGLYNHGYGLAAGTQGINCHHSLFPFVEGVDTNPFEGKAPDPEEAIANSKLRSRQRLLERNIRKDKQLIRYSQKMNDNIGEQHYKQMLVRHQKILREHIGAHDFLHRDYNREKVVSELKPKNKSALADGIKNKTTTLAQLHEKFGAHGFPQTVDEYRKVLYNKGDSRALRAYTTSRQRGSVEPVVTYKDYLVANKQFDQNIIGIKTSNGTTITGYSNHLLERVFGARQDASHDNSRREGVSIDHIQRLLATGSVSQTRGSSTKYTDSKAYIVVNSAGKLITAVPRANKKFRRGK